MTEAVLPLFDAVRSREAAEAVRAANEREAWARRLREFDKAADKPGITARRGVYRVRASRDQWGGRG